MTGVAAGSGPDRSARWKLVALVLLGLLLHVPMVRSGFFVDDYSLIGLLREENPYERSRPWNLYDFGTLADWTVHPGPGSAFPFWTDDAWRIRFFRPLSSLSLALDRELHGEDPLGFHLTSLGLYAVLLVLLHRLYLVLGAAPRAARLGLLIFLLGDATALPVGWIANRNSLLVVLFGVGACLAVARRPGVPRAGSLALAAGLALLAALSKESGALVFAALAALVTLRAREAGVPAGERRRATVIAVSLALATPLWLGGLALAGYGTDNVFYATPWTAPVRFAERSLVVFTLGALSLGGPLPVDLVSVEPALTYPAVLVALLVGVPLVRWIARRVRGRPGVRFLLAWTVLLLLPQAGAPVSDRTLFAATVGSAGILGVFLESLREARARGDVSRGEHLLGRVVLVSATLGSGLQLLGNELLYSDMAADLRETTLQAEAGSPADGPRHALVLQTENGFQGLAFGNTRIFETRDTELAVHLLQSGRRALRFERTGERVFELESLDRPFLTGMFEVVFLSSDEPPSVDPARPTVWRRDFLTVEPLVVDEGGLRRFRVTLPVSLDDPSVRFLVPDAGVLRRVEPPAVGETLELPAPVPRNPWVP